MKACLIVLLVVRITALVMAQLEVPLIEFSDYANIGLNFLIIQGCCDADAAPWSTSLTHQRGSGRRFRTRQCGCGGGEGYGRASTARGIRLDLLCASGWALRPCEVPRY